MLALSVKLWYYLRMKNSNSMAVRNPHALLHADFCRFEGGLVHYTQAGLRLYTRLFKQHDLPLPLPTSRVEFIAHMWRVTDAMVATALAELHEDLPVMSKSERAVAEGWLTGDPDARARASATIVQAHEDAAAAQKAGSNVTALSHARLHRR